VPPGTKRLVFFFGEVKRSPSRHDGTFFKHQHSHVLVATAFPYGHSQLCLVNGTIAMKKTRTWMMTKRIMMRSMRMKMALGIRTIRVTMRHMHVGADALTTYLHVHAHTEVCISLAEYHAALLNHSCGLAQRCNIAVAAPCSSSSRLRRALGGPRLV